MGEKHPKGLMVLFFTEMWERFGFYLLIGIMFLYMTAPDTGDKFAGMNLFDSDAYDILGTYLALVYLTPFIGGLLADRILGYRLSITIGGILFALGYLGLSIHNETAFYVSLGLIIIGNGFFKPNISALVGKLYNTDKYRKYKDTGFNIFYMGINIGALICNFVAAYLRLTYGWGWAFAAAGIGMILGLIWFWIGQLYAKDIKEVDIISPSKPEDTPLIKILLNLFIPAFAAGFLGWVLPTLIFGEPLLGRSSTDAFVCFSIPIVWFYFNIYRKAPVIDKKPIGALLSVFGVVIIFWAIFHQNSTALTNWAEKYTNREIPTAFEEVITKMHLSQNITANDTTIVLTDNHFVPILDKNNEIQYEIGPVPYFKNVPEMERPPAGKVVHLISTELFQSLNPGFIIILTFVVVGFFKFLRKRNKEPSTPAKIGYGLLITALSCLVMIGAVYYSQNGLIKASAWWLFSTYAVVTVGELCLSPMGLSLVSQLSPARFSALMMGGWFLSTALGNKLSGVLAGLWTFYDNKAFFFIVNTGLTMIAVVGIFILLPSLKKVVEKYSN